MSVSIYQTIERCVAHSDEKDRWVDVEPRPNGVVALCTSDQSVIMKVILTADDAIKFANGIIAIAEQVKQS